MKAAPQLHSVAGAADDQVRQSLAELALDMRWSWNHAADDLWRQLDLALWEMTHNPWVVLQTVSSDRIASVLADPVFRRSVEELVQARKAEAAAPTWFQLTCAESPLSCVAYFSMEFMLSEALPIYSGGLGNVAGDQLKAASDLGVPIVGVGLLYQQGYFRQLIDEAGGQRAVFPYNDPGQLPITPVRHANGEWLRLQLDLPGYPIWLRVWQVQVGRVKLYLLDSNDAANFPAYRGITSELYVSAPDQRLMQELVLGIGGWRLLTTLGIEPEVCHLNEGHAALAVLERARSFMAATGQPFEVALSATRAGNLFTTHTAVAAGFDQFSPSLIERCLRGYAEKELGIALNDLLALGRRNADDSAEDFNMAYLAVRGSGAVNGVSQLHEEVSRRLFAPLFTRWPLEELPIGHVTNGVHMPTWDSVDADELWTEAAGKDRWLGSTETLEHAIHGLSNARLWQFRTATSKSLVNYTREHLSRQRAAAGASPQAVEQAMHLLNPDALTLGFARRFATYKRPNLLLHDPERLRRLLTDPDRPVQLIIAGKAHPADLPGQDLIRRWSQFIRQFELGAYVIFLSDYDMSLTQHLVQGVDLWLNTPRRPWEASGTSGMKVLVNGGINLSELDGWWAEAYDPELGWSLGDGREHGEDPDWDAAEAQALYDILERHVVPEFYTRDRDGIPTSWVARMRESMARLTPQFSTNRTVRQYIDQYYVPAATTYRQRAADDGEPAARLVEWRNALQEKWSTLRFGDVTAETAENENVFQADVYLNGLDPRAVRVELYANASGGDSPFRQEMELARSAADPSGHCVYRLRVPTDRPAADYTVRLVPRHESAVIPLEVPEILWQR